MKSYDVVKIKEQFPALNRLVWDKPLIYLDSAASMQKPKKVLDAINKKITPENAVEEWNRFVSNTSSKSDEAP